MTEIRDVLAVAQDELGRLWVNGDITPKFKYCSDTDVTPGAYVYQAEHGIGLWVHPKSYSTLHDISTLDMRPDQWLPVTEVARELPPFAKN